MSIPTAIFLDTSVLDGQNYNFASVSLTSLVKLAKAKQLPLILPDPTNREILRHIRARSIEARNALETAKRAAPFLAKWQHFPKLKELKVSGRDWEVEQVALNEWRHFLGQFAVIPLDYKAIDISQVMDWYDAVQAPFREGKKRKEFPDALAIAALAAHAEKTRTYIAVVSLDKDLGSACDRFTYLMHFASLPALLELLLSDDKRLEQVRSLVASSQTVIIEAVEDALDSVPMSHAEPAFNDDVEAGSIDDVTISDVRVVALGDRDCTIAFDVGVGYSATLHWIERPDEHFRGSYYDEEYVPEPERARTTKVSDYAELPATAKIRFTDDRSRIDKVLSVEFEEDELVMTERP